jgi:hypothetical protein
VRSYAAGSPLAPMVAAAPAPAYEELVREVEGALGSFMRADSLCFPIEAQLARCRG